MHPYRTHVCGKLRAKHVGRQVRLAGWLHRRRDHGGLLFVDLRDQYGIIQCVFEQAHPQLALAENIRLESVIRIVGKVAARPPDTINSKLATGDIEVRVEELTVLSEVKQVLPMEVNSQTEVGEDIRLRYRFLDLRRKRMRDNVLLRSKVITYMRQLMTDQGFVEIQTPILTVSSPEGARDFLVPSRLHPGMFYALPQAPQQFKQLLMVAGFDRYFQIAPCFRDEDARADRSPGEFYQLDFEMAFATQEDVFAALEPVIYRVFEKFGSKEERPRRVAPPPFPRISYTQAILRYGSDKPDLRNPLEIVDVTKIFTRDDVSFEAFRHAISQRAEVRAIRAPAVSERPRRFFDELNKWARQQGAPGLGYVRFDQEGAVSGPIARFMTPAAQAELRNQAELQAGDAVFFVCDQPEAANRMAGLARTRIAEELALIDYDAFRLCWVVDFPMYQWNPERRQIEFSHNPFSMPQGGLEALDKDPLEILAYQYDIVCNGVELSSGAIRNHLPEVMEKAFAVAGYSPEELEQRFGGLLRAFRFGVPPHGGCALGIERMIMLLADEPNIRQVIPFPFNQQGQDLLIGAPSSVTDEQLCELSLKVRLGPAKIRN